MTLAMSAGIADKLMSIEDLVRITDEWEAR